MERKAKKLSQKIYDTIIEFPGPDENSKRLSFMWHKIVLEDDRFLVFNERARFANEIAYKMVGDARESLYELRMMVLVNLPLNADIHSYKNKFDELFELLS